MPPATSAIHIYLDGVDVAEGRSSETLKAIRTSLQITDIVDQAPSTCRVTIIGLTPTVGMNLIVTQGAVDGPPYDMRIFAGRIIAVNQTYWQRPENTRYFVSAIDYTWLNSQKKVYGRYTNLSATDIVTDLVTAFRYSASYGTTYVEAGLDTIDEITFSDDMDLSSALTSVAKRIGGHWHWDYAAQLHFGLLDASMPTPIDLDADHPSLESFSAETDLSQLITRVYVEGYGTTAAAAAAVGATSLAVVDAAFFESAGGTVVSVAGQRVTYTGIASGSTTVTGGTTTVAARPAPASAPSSLSVAAIGGTNQNPAGTVWDLYYTFVYSDGVESTASPGAMNNDPDGFSNPLLSFTILVGDARVSSRRIYLIPDSTPALSNRDILANNTTTSTAISFQTDGSNKPPASAGSYAAGVAYLYVSDCSKFAAGGGSARVGSNTFTYTGRSASSGVGALTGVSGVTGTIAIGASITAVVPAGSTSLPVADTTNFATGTARIGTQTFTFTGRSVGSGAGNLTGIPGSGAGSLASAVNGGDTVLFGAGGNGTLTGIPSSGAGSIVEAISLGDDVNILVTRNDTTAQTAMTALFGGTGIFEDYVQDRRIGKAEAEARADAILALRATALVRIRYTCRDPDSKAGATVHVDLPAPVSVTGDFKISEVVMSNFPLQADVFQLHQVTASSERYSLEDLLRVARRGSVKGSVIG